MSETQIWHGGDLDEARRLFPNAPEPWIDLSTGINPCPYPMPEIPSALFERLPSPSAHKDLEAAAAEAYGAADVATVAATPGTQVLISLLPALRPRSRVAILGPTYAEHARAWHADGHDVDEVTSLERAESANVVVLVNPNNPDGRFVQRHVLLRLAESLRQRGGWLVVDEAFADFDAAETLAPILPAGVVVLRSFGKTYGLPGLRLGFAVAERAIVERLRAALGPWAVSGPAIEIGRRALRDRDWRAAAGQARAADVGRLDSLLAPAGATRGTTLYRLVESSHGTDLFDHLGRQGIWVRRFRHDPRLLRFGLPGPEWAWLRLSKAIDTFFRRSPDLRETG